MFSGWMFPRSESAVVRSWKMPEPCMCGAYDCPVCGRLQGTYCEKCRGECKLDEDESHDDGPDPDSSRDDKDLEIDWIW